MGAQPAQMHHAAHSRPAQSIGQFTPNFALARMQIGCFWSKGNHEEGSVDSRDTSLQRVGVVDRYSRSTGDPAHRMPRSQKDFTHGFADIPARTDDRVSFRISCLLPLAVSKFSADFVGWASHVVEFSGLVLKCNQFFDVPLLFRSRCPVSLALEIFGDKWSLLIIRDLMFAGKRHFREFLESEESVASNILAERLSRLVEAQILTKRDDPTHKQKAIYSLTPMGIDLLPVVAQIGIWGRRHLPVTKESGANAVALEKHGERLLREIETKLRKDHLKDRRRASGLGR